MSPHRLTFLRRLGSEYGMLPVLLLLCVGWSAVTLEKQVPVGAAAGRQLAQAVVRAVGPEARVLVVAGSHADDVALARAAQEQLEAAGVTVVGVVTGEPVEARQALRRAAEQGRPLDALACTGTTATWHVFDDLEQDFPTLGRPQMVVPPVTWWPTFLKIDNLLNIAHQIAVIAILAVGMTAVIIAGGIDLSVGSLLALSAVVTTLLIERAFGGRATPASLMLLASLAGIGVAGLLGLINGLIVTRFRLPPFLVTLSMMLMASGLAGQLTRGESVYEVPDGFVWLGRGADLFGLPNVILLVVLLYVAAHVLMAHTVPGRHLYAVGGNREAARLSGAPVAGLLVLTYTLSGLLAGLGGVVMASQLRSGSPNYGQMYELYVIAAVVVGGTSLFGGEGKMFGTLIGAFVIAVINNGMNLTGISSFLQKVVLGAVILAAVLIDQVRRRAGARGLLHS